jgi:hypothetical protein
VTHRPGRGRPIWDAYNDTATLPVGCTNCGAQPGSWCTRPDGRVRRTPCLARITAATPMPHGEGCIPDATPTVDYTEPRHPKHEGAQ